jgi:ribosomal protein S18 acetylase RimI-like enzyme
MAQIVRADASRIDDARPLWLALREYHGSITEHWGALRPADDSWARRRRNYEDILAEGGAMFLAEEEGRVVGLAVCEREEGGSPTWEWPRDMLLVIDIIVLPEARRRGVGEALMAEVEREARERGVAALDLMVAAPNQAALRFYEKHGFRTDLLVLRKPL